MIVLDRISDFNEVIDYYAKVLETVKGIFVGMNIKQFADEVQELAEPKYYIPAIRAIIMNELLKIAQEEEYLEDHNINDEEINKVLTEETEDINLDSIKPKDPTMTEQEKIKQIRNCLAHGDFEIRLKDESKLQPEDDNENITIYINNGKVKGELSYRTFYSLSSGYYKIHRKVCDNKVEGICSYNIDVKGKNKEDLIKKFVRTIRVGNEKIDDKMKKFLEKWLMNCTNFSNKINVGEWTELSMCLNDLITQSMQGEKNYFINSRFALLEKKITYSSLSKIFLDSIRHLSSIDDTDTRHYGMTRQNILKSSFSKYTYEKPLLYADLLLGMTNYTIAYLKNVNDTSNDEIFNYIGIDMKDIKIETFQSNEQILKPIDLNKELEIVKKQIKHIKKMQKKYDEIKDENKRKLLEEQNKEKILEQERTLKKLEIQKKEIEKKIQTTGEVEYDTKNFFRHIRNSILHGRYRIDYKKYFNTRRVEDIIFVFQDVNENNELIFEATIKADTLYRLNIDLQKKVNDEIQRAENRTRYKEKLFKRSTYKDRNWGR